MADSTFAMAHAQIATILGNLGEQRQRRVNALTTAYAHRDRLTERERYGVEAAYYSNVEQDPDRVASAYENILELDPRDRVALNNLSDIYLYLRDYERSEALAEQAIQVDSTILTPYWNAAEAAARRGDFGDARGYLDAFDGVTPGTGWTDAFRAMLSASEGDFDAADSLVRAGVAPDPVDALNRLVLAVDLAASHATRGRLREAHGYLLEMAEVNESRELPAEALRNLVWAALLDLHVAADTAAALERIEAALERYPMDEMAPLDRPYRELAELYAWAGDPVRARAYLSAYEAEVPASQRDNVEFVNFKLHVPSLERARGSIALAEGRPRDAVELFRRSDVGYCRLCSLSALAWAYDAAGSADSAIAVYERYLALPEPFRPWSGDAFYRGPTMFRLGELYESRDPTRAATYYSQFVQLWADADPALAGTVGVARQRLQRLLAEPGPTERSES
jgi:tetratricopeptide (TPR) repeat protein